jgi:hypothetical protein
MLAMTFFLISLMAPKKPPSEVEFSLASHCSSWLYRISTEFIRQEDRNSQLDELAGGVDVKGDQRVDQLLGSDALEVVVLAEGELDRGRILTGQSNTETAARWTHDFRVIEDLKSHGL